MVLGFADFSLSLVICARRRLLSVIGSSPRPLLTTCCERISIIRLLESSEGRGPPTSPQRHMVKYTYVFSHLTYVGRDFLR